MKGRCNNGFHTTSDTSGMSAASSSDLPCGRREVYHISWLFSMWLWLISRPRCCLVYTPEGTSPGASAAPMGFSRYNPGSTTFHCLKMQTQRSSAGRPSVVPETFFFFCVCVFRIRWRVEYSAEWQPQLRNNCNVFFGCFSEKSVLTFFFLFLICVKLSLTHFRVCRNFKNWRKIGVRLGRRGRFQSCHLSHMEDQ